MSKESKPVVYIIDNYDSFSFNLAEEFLIRGCKVEVWRNNVDAHKTLKTISVRKGPKLIVLSPGPGTPDDAGACVEIVKQNQGKLPILGICLGHQAIVQAYGGIIAPSPKIVHGKSSKIIHNESGIFAGIAADMRVGRYHSLVAGELPKELEIHARYKKIIMAVKHKVHPVIGLQFHPESILTTEGGMLVDNVIAWTQVVSA